MSNIKYVSAENLARFKENLDIEIDEKISGGGSGAYIEEYTFLANGWDSGGQYSLEEDYPSDTYDIYGITTSNDSTTTAMLEAWSAAEVYGYDENNIVTAHGTIPSINITMTLLISKREKSILYITKPTVTVGTYTYNGTAQGPTIVWYDSDDVDKCIVTNATKTDAGSYILTIALKDTGYMKWSNNTTADLTYSYSIAKVTLIVPTVSGSYTYDSTQKSATITGFDSNTMSKSGDESATNAGTYTVIFGLVNSDNYQYATTPSGTWSIAKATPTVSLSPSSASLAPYNPPATITVTKSTNEAGDVTATSSNTSICTVSVSGNVVTITRGNTEGSATVTISTQATSNWNTATPSSVSVTNANGHVYGASWDGTSTTSWTRTDEAANFTDPVPAVNGGTGSSPFDNCSPWKDMTIVDNSDAGKVVKIPKFYYKWTRTGSNMKLQIADSYVSGFYVSPAHADRGDGKGERDFVYVGRYHCGASTYKSTSGVKPEANHTRAECRTSIHNLGSTIWQWDYAMFTTIQMLYLVEFADWNSQAKIGYGCGNGISTENMGSTDSMQYHTGTMAANRTTYTVGIQYRYIEGLWSNLYAWCDGIYFSGADIYCIKNPTNFSDTANGTKVGTRAMSSGFISAYTTPTASGFEYAIYANAVSGSDLTYVCDYYSYDKSGTSGVVLLVGGSFYSNQNRGLFLLGGDHVAEDTGTYVGCRLMELP